MRVILYSDLRSLHLAEWRGYIEGVSEYLAAWERDSMPDTEQIEEMAHANPGG